MDTLALAEGLKNSNIPEVAQLATSYIDLQERYDLVLERLIEVAGEKVFITHEKLFRRLADMGD